MNKFSLLFLTNCFLLIFLNTSAENLIKPQVWSSNGSNIEEIIDAHHNNQSDEYNEKIHFNDDNEEEEEEEQEEEEEEEEDHMLVSETVDKRKNNLDNTISDFLGSGISMILEARNVFNEELNHTKTESEAKDVWIAYSNSWHRVMEALVKDIMRKILDSSGSIDISINCISAMIAITSGLKKQKDWAVKCKSTQ